MPVSNPAQLTSVVAIFGGPGSLSSYLAGGTYVPPGTTGVNGAVPSSLPIPLSKLAGTVNFTPVTNTYTSGSGNETVPTGASSLTLTVVGAGGTGGSSYTDSGSDIYNSGGGGGGAGYSTITRAVASGDWSTTVAYSVGTSGGVSSTTTGSLAAGSVSLTGGGGSSGTSADSGSGGAGGAGGSASGGSTNTSGSAGGNGSTSSSSGNPGGAGGASGGTAYGTGGDGASAPGTAGAVGGGVVIFAWT
jgi:hypothetical protein